MITKVTPLLRFHSFEYIDLKFVEKICKSDKWGKCLCNNIIITHDFFSSLVAATQSSALATFETKLRKDADARAINKNTL